MADRGEKRRRGKCENVNILRTKKRFLGEISIFHNFLRAIVWLKKKRKIEDTNLSYTSLAAMDNLKVIYPARICFLFLYFIVL